MYEGVEDARRWDHTLSGPIAVNHAQPGDTLEIRLRVIDLWLPIAGQGIVPNRGLLPEEFPYARDRVLWLDLATKTVEYLPGVVLPLKPFWGVIGVAHLRAWDVCRAVHRTSSAGTWTIAILAPGARSICRSMCPAPCCRQRWARRPGPRGSVFVGH